MEVYIVFQSRSWADADYHTEWNVYGVYSSEEKATEVMTSLKKDEENYCNSLSDWERENEYEETSYRMEKHQVQ